MPVIEPLLPTELEANWQVEWACGSERCEIKSCEGTINAADREVPFSGGRAVEGGTPFGWQLNKEGKPGQVFAAWAIVGQAGKVIVLGDAMATLFLGTPDGARLTGVPRDPTRTTFWGKDSAIFVEELLTWLTK